MIDCVYCNSPEIKARTIFRNDLVWAFPTNMPITPGHILLSPIRHVATFEDLTNAERDALFTLAIKMKPALKSLFGAEGFHHVWNENEVGGQSVPHFHLHLVPRSSGDTGITEYEPRKFLYRPGSRESTPEEELRVVAEQIKDKYLELES